MGRGRAWAGAMALPHLPSYKLPWHHIGGHLPTPNALDGRAGNNPITSLAAGSLSTAGCSVTPLLPHPAPVRRMGRELETSAAAVAPSDKDLPLASGSKGATD